MPPIKFRETGEKPPPPLKRLPPVVDDPGRLINPFKTTQMQFGDKVVTIKPLGKIVTLLVIAVAKRAPYHALVAANVVGSIVVGNTIVEFLGGAGFVYAIKKITGVDLVDDVALRLANPFVEIDDAPDSIIEEGFSDGKIPPAKKHKGFMRRVDP